MRTKTPNVHACGECFLDESAILFNTMIEITTDEGLHMPFKTEALKPFCIFLLLTFAAAYFGSQFMPGPWYASLAKSSLNPPDAVFPLAWTILYFLMPVSMTAVYMRAQGTSEYKVARNLFLAQLFVNALWTWLFFGLHQPLWAFVDIICLWVLVLLMICAFARVSKWAALLQVPYLCWLSFAGWLNWAIWSLNPS